jgi:phage shock protein A
MSETLFVRVKRIVSANINDVVDNMEKAQAEIVMKEAIREVDKATDEVRAELGKAMAKGHHANSTIEQTKKKIADLSEKAKFAIEQKRDDLAEAALARQIDLEAQIPVLDAVIADAKIEQGKLEEFVAALNGRKREMQADLKSFEEARIANAVDAASSTNTTSDRVNKAEAVFDRAMKSASGLEAMRTPGTAVKIAELEQLARARSIADRLADLKKSA